MAVTIDIQVNDEDLGLSFAEFRERLPAATKDGRLRFARYMRTEIARRVKASEDPERGSFLGILYTSRPGLVHKNTREILGLKEGARRTKKRVKSAEEKARKEKLRAPIGMALPLLWKQGRASKVAFHIDDDDSIRIAPIADFVVFHHRSEFTGHGSKGIMPDRSFFYTTDIDEKKAVDFQEEAVQDSMQKSFGGR